MTHLGVARKFAPIGLLFTNLSCFARIGKVKVVVNMNWQQAVLYLVLGILIGAIAGFFIARYVFRREMEKNPPVTEKMIRAMFLQMGRKPSEAQIRAIMKTMGQDTTKKSDKK